MAAPPIDLGAAALPTEAHRRVAAEGAYLHAQSVFVGPRPVPVPPSEPAAQRRMRGVLSAPGSAAKRGYLLVTPLEVGASGEEEEEEQTVGGWARGWRRARRRLGGSGEEEQEQDGCRVVLVNRGWVPPEWLELWPLAFGEGKKEGELVMIQEGGVGGAAEREEQAAKKAAAAALRDAQPRGRVRVTGVAQADETPSSFVPRNPGRPGSEGRDRRHFFSVVAEEIAEACGVWSPAAAAAAASPPSSSSSSPPPPPPPLLVQVCYDDSPGGGGVLDPEGRGERPTTLALPAELEAAERRSSGAALQGEAAAEHERRIARAAARGRGDGASVFPLPKPASGLVRFSIMPEDHAGYATMWGMMSAAMAYLALVRRRGGVGARRRPPPPV
jgi:cytochrome oxidase assembly protein ShyY1